MQAYVIMCIRTAGVMHGMCNLTYDTIMCISTLGAVEDVQAHAIYRNVYQNTMGLSGGGRAGGGWWGGGSSLPKMGRLGARRGYASLHDTIMCIKT